MLVATPGGHIDELWEFAARLAPTPSDRIWVTSQTAQTSSLLAGERVEWVPPVGSRQALRAAASLPRAVSLVRRLRPSEVISSGAALAVPYLVAARLTGVPTSYVESATRTSGPSVTGRLLERLPGIKLRYQGEGWTRRRWEPTTTVFDRYRSADRPANPHDPLRIVVTVGSERFQFNRAIRAVAAAAPEGCELTWQLGHTPGVADLPGTAHQWIGYDQLVNLMARSDVVVCHAGVGSVLTALRAGRTPIVLPRLAMHGEHVDDHQVRLADALDRRGLVIVGSSDATQLRTQIGRAARRQAVLQD